MYDALIFDMDGLMIDTEGYYWVATRTVAGRYGKTVSDETLGRMMGRAPSASIEVLKSEVGLPGTVESLLLERDTEVMAALRRRVDPMPGLLELMRQFAPHLKYAIATGSRQAFVDIVMSHLRIQDQFTAIQPSDDIRNGKPHPEVYLRAIERLGTSPQRSIVLEDSSNGARAGKSAGAYTIAVPSPYTQSQDFSFVDYRAADLFDAATHIAKLLNQSNHR